MRVELHFVVRLKDPVCPDAFDVGHQEPLPPRIKSNGARKPTDRDQAVDARLREREPVSWLPALAAWVVTRRDLALEVMRDDETFTVDDPRFSTGQVVGRSMLTTDGAEHSRHRDPFARRF